MSSKTTYAALTTYDPTGTDANTQGYEFVSKVAGNGSDSNMVIIDGLLKEKASIKIKTAAEWTADTTTILRSNDFGIASDSGVMKRGDGSSTWSNLLDFDPTFKNFVAAGYSGSQSDFYTLLSGISNKISKVSGGTTGNLTSLTADGSIADSGKKASDFAVATHAHGNITTDGKIGSTANNIVVTETSGAIGVKTAAEMRTLLNVANGADVTASAMSGASAETDVDSTNDTVTFNDNSASTIKKITFANIFKKIFGTLSGLLKADGSGNLSAAVAGSDYAVPSSSATTTLVVASWDSGTKTQTVSVVGVTATNNVLVNPAAASFDGWTSAGIYCSAQAVGTLTFTATTIPTTELTANIIILG